MDFQELRANIIQARSLKTPVPPLPFQNIRELLHARSESKDQYLTYIDSDDQEAEISYGEFYQQVRGCARFLQQHGLSRGDRVATIAHNHWHTVIQYFAAWMLGLVVVPINLEEEDDYIANILENGQIELAFVRTEYRDRFRKILERYDQLKHIEWIVCEGELANFTTDKGTFQLDEDLSAKFDALIVFTPGETGQPNGVVLTQRNLLEEARAIAEWHDIDNQTRMLGVMPIHHVNGTVATLLTSFWAGGSVVLTRGFSAKPFFSLIRDKQVHVVNLTLAMLQQLNSHYKGEERPETGSLRHVICGGSPLTLDVAQTFEEQFEVRIIHGYGWAEATCYSTFIPIGLSKAEHQKWQRDYDYPSVGVPIVANEMAIWDDKGDPLGEKEYGEVVIRGVNVMERYSNNRKANETAFQYGWFRTGDEGFYINDDEGRPYFFITGRSVTPR